MTSVWRTAIAAFAVLAVALFFLAVLFWPKPSKGDQIKVFYSRTLPAEAIRPFKDIAEAIGDTGSMEISLRPIPLLGTTNQGSFVLTADKLRQFRTMIEWPFERLHLYQYFAAWLEAEYGLYFLAPGEVEVRNPSDDPVPFDVWFRNKGSHQNAYQRRHLIGLGSESHHWITFNRLNYGSEVDWNHGMYRIITPEDFRESPHLFAKDADGKPMRPPFGADRIENDHPDYLDPRTVIHTVNAAIAAFAADKNRGVFSIAANDSFEFGNIPQRYRDNGYFNQYADRSNYVFEFENKVAEIISEEFPDRYLTSLAYLMWQRPPDFPLEPNLYVLYATDAMQWWDEEIKHNDLKVAEEWTRSGSRKIGKFEYLFSRGYMIPRSPTSLLADSIRAYHDLGYRGYYALVSPLWGYDAHTTWLAAQLTWDASQDPEELLEKYFLLYYGPAAEPMRGFFDTAERIWMKQPGKGSWLRYWKDPHQAVLYGDKELAELESWLALAERDSDRESRFARRVEYTRDLFEMTKRFVEIVYLRWALSIGEYGDFEATYRPFDLGELDLGSAEGVRLAVERLHTHEEAFKAETERLVAKTHLHSRLRLPEWIFEDDPSSRALERIGATDWQTLFSGWDGWEESWRVSLLDTEDAAIELKGEFVEAGNVFRGFLHRSARAEPKKRYRAVVPIEGQVGPSSFIYVRLDFYDAEFNSLGKSKWDRLPPGTYNAPFVVGPVMEAPDKSAYVRLYIRLFHQEHGDWLRIGSPRLNESQ